MSEGTGTLVASAVITGFAIVAVALRFYVRMRLKVGVAWDDWSIFAGLVLSLITAGLLVWGTYISPLFNSKYSGLKAGRRDRRPRRRESHTGSHRQPHHRKIPCQTSRHVPQIELRVPAAIFPDRYRDQSLHLAHVSPHLWRQSSISTPIPSPGHHDFRILGCCYGRDIPRLPAWVHLLGQPVIERAVP